MTSSTPSTLRVVTLNLASGRGQRGERLSQRQLTDALAPLAALNADVVALQEVDTAQERSGGLDQAALVGSILGLEHWRSAPTLAGTPGPLRTWRNVAGQLRGGRVDGGRASGSPGAEPDDGPDDGPYYGIALLSRTPVVSWHTQPLAAGSARLPLRAPDPRTGRIRWWAFPDEPRVAVAAVLEGGHLVAATHLSFAPVTARVQLRTVRRWLAGLDHTDGLGHTDGLDHTGGLRLLAGDLNLPGPLRPRSAVSLVRAATFPSLAPRLQLDHVLDLRATRSGTGAAASGRALALASGDHCALVVDVTLPSAAL